MENTNKILATFPGLHFKMLEGGIQAVWPSGLKLTFYFKSGKFHNNRTKNWKHITTQPRTIGIINVIKQVGERQEKYIEAKEIVAQGAPDNVGEVMIDHIKRKLETLEKFDDKDKPNIQGRLMLKILLNELPQYL